MKENGEWRIQNSEARRLGVTGDVVFPAILGGSPAGGKQQVNVPLARNNDLKIYEDGASLEPVGYPVGATPNSPTARRPRWNENTLSVLTRIAKRRR